MGREFHTVGSTPEKVQFLAANILYIVSVREVCSSVPDGAISLGTQHVFVTEKRAKEICSPMFG